jgi:hypothetical protein
MYQRALIMTIIGHLDEPYRNTIDSSLESVDMMLA